MSLEYTAISIINGIQDSAKRTGKLSQRKRDEFLIDICKVYSMGLTEGLSQFSLDEQISKYMKSDGFIKTITPLIKKQMEENDNNSHPRL